MVRPRSVERDKFFERRLAFAIVDLTDGHRESFAAPDEDGELLRAGETRVDEVSKEHIKMLAHDRDDDGLKLRTLRLVSCATKLLPVSRLS